MDWTKQSDKDPAQPPETIFLENFSALDAFLDILKAF